MGITMELTVKRFEELINRELYDVLQARIAVFVVEQNCPFQEIDGKDFFSYHVFYTEDGRIQAYVRVVEPTPANAEISIGRVLTIKRGTGLGREIMLEGIRSPRKRWARRGFTWRRSPTPRASMNSSAFGRSRTSFWKMIFRTLRCC